MTEVILTPDVMTILNNAVNECVDSIVRSQAEAEFRKDVISRVKEECDMSAADFNKLVKERFDSTISTKIEDLEKIVSINEALIKHGNRNTTIEPDDQE